MKKYLLLLLPLQAMAQIDADSNNWFRIQTNFVENPATAGENGRRLLSMAWGNRPTVPEYFSLYGNPKDPMIEKIAYHVLAFFPNSTITFQTQVKHTNHSFGFSINSVFDDKESVKTNFLASYAYQLFDDYRGRLQIGINSGVVRKTVDYNRFTFGDMIEPTSGFTFASSEPFSNYNHVTKFNTNLGLFWQKKNWYAGSSLQNVLEPNLSHFDKQAPLYRVWQNDVGYLHRINQQLKLTGMMHTETNRQYTLLRPALMLLYKDKWYIHAEASLLQLYMFKLGRYSYNRWRWQVQFDRNGRTIVLPKNSISFNFSHSLQKKQK